VRGLVVHVLIDILHVTSLVYSNSLLATLNSRSRIREALNDPVSIELSGSLSHKDNTPQVSRRGLGSNRTASPLGSLSFAKKADTDHPFGVNTQLDDE
jgi:hypothetical protein